MWLAQCDTITFYRYSDASVARQSLPGERQTQVRGGATVILAMGDGRKAAANMHAALSQQ